MRRIQFSNFEIDLDLYNLTRDGKPIEIGRRPLDLLLCLIENHDRVVDRDFLRRELWDSAPLSESAIPTCVLEIRRALEDDASNPRFIEGKRGRGYRFIGEVHRLGGRTDPSAHSREQFKFVGREEELESLKAIARHAAHHSKGSTILISGEAGIGKSRLINELSQSKPNSLNFFYAKSQPRNGAPPYWPWIQILDRALLQLEPKKTSLTEQANHLFSLLTNGEASITERTQQQTQRDRHALFSQWTKCIRAISESGPVIFVVEDAHLADSDSLNLLYWLADAIDSDPILLIATHRPFPTECANEQAISDICGIPSAQQMLLRPLSCKAITSLIDPLEPNRNHLGQSLKARTGGNAFFVTHLLRNINALRRAHLTGTQEPPLPLNGRELLAKQISGLPNKTQECLAAASVLGDHFSVEQLALVQGEPRSTILSQLQPARRVSIIRETETCHVFNHSILQEALYGNLNDTKRRATHLRIAQVLRHCSNAESQTAQIADHLARALPLGSHEDAWRYAQKAGQEATAQLAFSHARMHLQKALAILGIDPSSSLDDQYKILLELALATLYAGDRNESRKLLLAAADIARATGRSEHLAECALSLAPDFLTIEVGTFDPTLIQLLEEALAVTENHPDALRAQLLARLSQALQWSDTRPRGRHLAEKSLEAAKASGDKNALLAALSARAESLHGPKNVDQRIAHLANLGIVARQINNLPAALLHQTKMISAHLEIGDLRNLEICNRTYKNLTTSADLPQYRWYPIATDCMLATLRGDLDRADNLAKQYQHEAGSSPDNNFRQTFACQLILREVERDHASSIVPLVSEYAQQHNGVLSWSAALAWINWNAGLADEALGILKRFSKKDIETMALEAGGGIGIAGLSEVAARLGHTQQASYLYSVVRAIAKRHASAGYGVAYFGSFARYAGLLAASLGRHTEAERYFKLAVERESVLGALSWKAYALADLRRTSPEGKDILTIESQSRSLAKEAKELGLKRAERHAAYGMRGTHSPHPE